MFIVKHKKIFFIFTALVMALSIFAIFGFGLNYGIDFTGGSIMEVRYVDDRPEFTLLREEILERQAVDGSFTLQAFGENSYVVRTPYIEDEGRETLLDALSFGGTLTLTEERFNSVGPIIGAELRQKALIAIFIVLVAIILFIAYAFKQISHPVSAWKYGIAAVIALFHDIIVPVGLFATLGYFVGAEIDVLFVMALLAILGFSVNDTIVVFDRVRENLTIRHEKKIKETFEETVGRSLNQTYVRSINTSITTLFVLSALYFLGGAVTQNFSLVLLTGVIAGTYSSIFLASPLLLVMEKRQKSRA
jgi:preprotein translocase subunit SecF